MLPHGYTLHHNIGHHLRYMDQERDPNRWKTLDGRTLPPWRFAWILFVNMYPNVIRIGREYPALYRRFVRMFWVCSCVLLVFSLIDPVNTFLVFVLPLPVALVLQAQATAYHHSGLESRDPMHASRSAVGTAYQFETGGTP